MSTYKPEYLLFDKHDHDGIRFISSTLVVSEFIIYYSAVHFKLEMYG